MKLNPKIYMARSKAYAKSIFCLETEWSDKITEKNSVLPVLELLRDTSNIDFIYRKCATVQEFKFYLHKLKSYKKYSICYLAFHGTAGYIEMADGKSLYLEEVAKIANGAFSDRIVHFGSCKTVKIKEQEAQEFIEITNAQMVSGYMKNVGFVESAAMDMLYFAKLNDYIRFKSMENNISKHYESLANSLGFKIFHR